MKFPEERVDAWARIAAEDTMGQIEAHIDAHPLRYGVIEDAEHEELGARLRVGFRRVIGELELSRGD